jgi:hypothetical protein
MHQLSRSGAQSEDHIGARDPQVYLRRGPRVSARFPPRMLECNCSLELGLCLGCPSVISVLVHIIESNADQVLQVYTGTGHVFQPR